MSRIFVVAPDAFVAVTGTCKDDASIQALIGVLNNLVAQAEITFAHETEAECKTYAYGEAITNWVIACSGNVGETQAPYDFVGAVLDDCSELLAQDETDPTAVSVSVLALAISKKETISDVYLVTEEEVDVADSISLTTACKRMAVDRLSLRQFVHMVANVNLLL